MPIFADLDAQGRPVRFLVLADDAEPPAGMVAVTADEWRELLAKQAAAVLDVARPDGSRVVAVTPPPPPSPPTPAERAAAELAGSPLLGALVSELAARFGVTRAALVASLSARASQ